MSRVSRQGRGLCLSRNHASSRALNVPFFFVVAIMLRCRFLPVVERFEFLMKSNKSSYRRVIPVKTGTVSSYFNMLPESWPPVFTGVTTFDEFIKFRFPGQTWNNKKGRFSKVSRQESSKMPTNARRSGGTLSEQGRMCQ
jgi:hypothetical protein